MTFKAFFRTIVALLPILWSAAALCAPPATAPSTQPAKSSLDADDEHRERTLELTRKSIELLKAGKYDQARGVLVEVLELDPTQPTNLYNMACLEAIQGHPDAAMKYLQKSAEAGFTDFIHIAQDPDLVSLRNLQRYKDFLASRDFFQHKAAEAVVIALKHQFGDSYLYEIDDTDKLVFATNTDADTLQALKKALVAQAHSQWTMLFANKPEQFIVVVVPSLKDYARIVRMPYVEGFYNHAARTLIAKGLGFVTMHEFTHALHAADLDPLGQDHPIWLVEGMAVLFEHAEYEGDVLTPRDNVRLYALQLAGRQNHTIPFTRLFGMKQREFVNRANLAYAEAGSIMHYLYDHQLLRKFYDTYKTNYEKDKSGKLALEQVTGKTLVDVEHDWKAWMLKRTPPIMRPETGGPYIGVMFGTANDGMRIETVAPSSPGAAAGLKVGDIVVGLGELDVRDVTTFMPLLATHKAGDLVTLRVRREADYLEVPVRLGRRGTLVAVTPTTRPATTRPSAKPATAPAPLRRAS